MNYFQLTADGARGSSSCRLDGEDVTTEAIVFVACRIATWVALGRIEAIGKD